ncbi:MAG: DUF1631 family protein [Burkholderiales bacterium]|nr:DUF1631 family protein [Burkholderiales bacterium]MDE2565516.1 DUF1631 family protein [Burkholderiales bacterium]
MSARQISRALNQFVDDELLRAPLLFDQLVDGTIEHARAEMADMPPVQRGAIADMLESLLAQRPRLGQYFTRSLGEQARQELAAGSPAGGIARPATPGATRPRTLALVDDATVALDVELSHAIEAIKSIAEYELRELQTYTAALVGDMDVAADHNPFRAETYARALWDAAQALPLSRGHQVAFMRHAGVPLAHLLRKSYAAASSRLESMGVEPAAYRTLILPAGSRRGTLPGETTFSPDLQRMRDSMSSQRGGPQTLSLRLEGQPAPLPTAAGALAGGAARAPETWRDIARQAANPVDRQSVELVSRLFDAMRADPRVPHDVAALIARLQGPAMRLTLRDSSLLDQDRHPLWRFINRLAFEAEMTPDPADPERAQLLAAAQSTVERLGDEPDQSNELYRWAIERLDLLQQRRMARRLAAAASQIGALQKLEDKLADGGPLPSTLHGMLDVPHLDTVPAELIESLGAKTVPDSGGESWLDELRPGDWVRMFIQGHWVQARLLWPGERREIWLFADGASDDTWAVRRGALLTMRTERLAKKIRERSIVGSAAARVQEALAAPKPA